MSRQTTADWLNVMEKCLYHILQEMIRKVHSKTAAYGDGCRHHQRHVERFRDRNKLYIVDPKNYWQISL